MMRSLALLVLVTPMLSGCSFRAPAVQYGQILSLSVLPPGYNDVYTIRAQVSFVGDTQPPTLRIAPGTQETTIQVMAVTRFKGHFMDWGIIPVDYQTPHVLTLETPVALRKPGTYRIEGIRLDALGEFATTVTAGTEVRIEDPLAPAQREASVVEKGPN